MSAGLVLALSLGLAGAAFAGPRLTSTSRDTLAAFGDALRSAMHRVPLGVVPAGDLDRADERLRRIERASSDGPPVDARSLSRAPGSAEPARTLGERPAWLAQDVDSLLWFYGSYLEDSLARFGDSAAARGVEARVQAIRHLAIVRAQQAGLARLLRYEVKYGTGAPKLNFAEVLLNAALQRLSIFAPGRDGPSPCEALLAYSTSCVTLGKADDAQAVSVIEAGIRRYNFGWDPRGRGSWMRMLEPRYVSLGVAIAEARDGALRWPLRGAADRASRVGPFFTWGDLKFAMLLGPESRFLVSRQVHLLPNLF